MEFRPKLHLAAMVGLLVGWGAQSQASRHPGSVVQSPPSQAAPRDPSAARSAPRNVVVEGIAIAGDKPFQLQVRTTGGVTPQTQVVTGPERLVIDVPGATPGRALRSQTVNRGQVERVRVGLFSASPQVTRIVLDLNSPTDYRIQTDASGFTVTLGDNTPPADTPANTPGETKTASDDRQTIGWVTTKSATANIVDTLRIAPSSAPDPVNPDGVRVLVRKGQMEIHARNATLSEVLFQVEQQTGAEIAIPAGTERQRVIGDFGPGTASEVLAQLLNGSDLNFVVVGSQNNPGAVSSVILTHKSPDAAEFVPRDNTLPPASAAPNPQSPLAGDTRPEESFGRHPASNGAGGAIAPEGQTQPDQNAPQPSQDITPQEPDQDGPQLPQVDASEEPDQNAPQPPPEDTAPQPPYPGNAPPPQD